MVVLHDLDVPKRKVPVAERENEVSRFEQCLMETRRQISVIRAEVAEKLSDEEAGIFDAHQMVLEDRALIEETVTEVLNSGLNIEFCFKTISDRYIDAFSRIDDDYIKERAADIRDVSRRVLSNLMGKTVSGLETLRGDSILIADDLVPSDTVSLDRGKVAGIVTEFGGRTSHSVIMARSLGIPCVVGVPELLNQIAADEPVLIDGYEGMVIIRPSLATLDKYDQIEMQRATIEARFKKEKDLETETMDGKVLKLHLNIDGSETAEFLKFSGGTGVGLFRTEMLFMGPKGYPDEASQYHSYKRIVEAMAPYPVTIRTLDLGGDKNPHSSLWNYQEANPFMGFRAIRFCLDNPDVFKTQLRAILRSSAHGTVKVMYPMISSCEEMIAANKLLEECKDQLRSEQVAFDEGIECGCMIEVPSAAVIADLLAEHADFFSIGTNDLVQYLLAVDRVNDRISHLYDPNQPSVMRTVNFIIKAGHRKGKPVSVCGEMAGEPIYAVLLLGMGVDELSLSAGTIPELKYLIRHLDFSELCKLSERVLRMTRSADVALVLKEFYDEHMQV